jgi:flagellin
MPPNLINSSAVSSANYYLGKNQKNLQESIKRLASGKKISGPGDDPGNLAVSMKLNAQLSRISGLKNSIQNGISFLEVQDGALQNAANILERMTELKTLAAQDPIKSAQDVINYNNEFQDLQSQLYSVSQSQFNGVTLFASKTESNTSAVFDIERYNNITSPNPPNPDFFPFSFSNDEYDNSIAINSGEQSGLTVNIDVHRSLLLSAVTLDNHYVETLSGFNIVPSLLSLDYHDSNTPNTRVDGNETTADYVTLAVESGNSLNIPFLELGDISLGVFEKAAENISTLRAQNGATQSRLNFTSDHISSYETGLRSAIGRIEDVDIAEESANLAKHSILTKASAAMVAQASQSTQSIMRTLLGN